MEVLEVGAKFDDLYVSNNMVDSCPGWCEYDPDTNCWRDAD